MNKTTEKETNKAMALEFKKCFDFVFTFCFVFVSFHFVLHEELFFACWYITFLETWVNNSFPSLPRMVALRPGSASGDPLVGSLATGL